MSSVVAGGRVMTQLESFYVQVMGFTLKSAKSKTGGSDTNVML